MNQRIWIIPVFVVLLSSCLIGRNSEARPKFSKIFQTTYEKEYVGKDLGGKSCTICHDKTNDNKYLSNDYGEAMKESLSGKNTKEESVIVSALKDTEEKPSAVEGKTFGDLIREGRLPASK